MNEVTYELLKNANESIKTTDIKGKEYAEVNQRIKAFRMVYPTGSIQTEIISINNGVVIFKASAYDEEGKLLGTGYAQEKEGSTFINKTSYIENCETSSVGRCLGMCGFGIDTSVASAEEVENAIAQQNQQQFEYATAEQIETLEKINLPKEWLEQKFGVETVDKLAKAQAETIIKAWKKKQAN